MWAPPPAATAEVEAEAEAGGEVRLVRWEEASGRSGSGGGLALSCVEAEW